MIFQEKYYFSCYSLLSDQILLSGCLYFLKFWAIGVLQLFVVQSVTSNFKINHSFLIKSFFLKCQYVNFNNVNITKNVLSQERKEHLTWNKTHFLPILKEFQFLKIVSEQRVNLLLRNCVKKYELDGFFGEIIKASTKIA